MTRQRLTEALGLREGEGARTLRLSGFVFLLMAAVVLAKTAQSGVFLAAYDRSRIPDAFVLSALSLVAAGFATSAFAARLRPAALIQWLLVLSGAAFVGGRLALGAGVPHIAMAIYVAIEVACGLLLVQGWAFVSEAVDARSAKRVIPLVGAAGGLAWVLGFFAGPLARWLGTPALLFIAPGLLLAALALSGVIQRLDVTKAAMPRSRSLMAEAVGAMRHVVRDRLLRVFAIIAILDMLIEQLVNFQLKVSAQLYYVHEDAITGFTGKLFGISGIATVVLPLLLGSRILVRFGGARSMRAAAMWTLAGALAIAGWPVLVLVAATSAGDRILKQLLSSPGRSQLQTTVPPVRRAQAGALTKGVLAPAFYALGGAVLKLVPRTVSLSWPALVTAVLSLVVLTVIWRGVPRAYVGALRANLDQRQLSLDGSRSGFTTDPAGLAADLASPDPGRALFAVTLARGVPPAVARPLLRGACSHPAPEVRAAAVMALGKLGQPEDAAVLSETLERETDDAAERACLTALATLGVGDVPAAERRADDANLRMRALARACLARAAGDSGPALAGKGMLAMLASSRPEDRAAGAWAVGELRLGQPALRASLATLLADESAEVRSQALWASGRLGGPELGRVLVAGLGDEATQPAAIEALAALDDAELGTIEPLVRDPSCDVERLEALARALQRSRGPRGDALLASLLAHPHRRVRYRAARALARRRRRAGFSPPSQAVVDTALRAEVEIAYRYYALLVGIARTDGVDDFHIEPDKQLLGRELDARLHETERRILAVLALRTDPRVVRIAETKLRRRGERVTAQVIELLENTLEPRLAAEVVPLLEPMPLRERLEAARRHVRLDPRDLADPLGGVLALDDPHLTRCALICYRERAARERPELLEGEAAMLPLVERVGFLRTIPLFHELPAEDLLRVAKIASSKPLTSGSVIFHKGDPGDMLYLILEGEVAVKDGGRVIAKLGAGEFFGELALFDDQPRSADAVANQPGEVLTLAGADLEELMERRPVIAREIIRVLTRRLRATTTQPAASEGRS